jgi:hypothetical protein
LCSHVQKSFQFLSLFHESTQHGSKYMNQPLLAIWLWAFLSRLFPQLLQSVDNKVTRINESFHTTLQTCLCPWIKFVVRLIHTFLPTCLCQTVYL